MTETETDTPQPGEREEPRASLDERMARLRTAAHNLHEPWAIERVSVELPHLLDMVTTLARELAEARAKIDMQAAMNRILRHQADPSVHPLTCGIDSSHMPLLPEVRDGAVVLVCRGSVLDAALGRSCEYVQTFVPALAPAQEVRS